MTAPLERRALAVIRESGPLSCNAIARILRKRHADVSGALRALDVAGHVTWTPDGYCVARGTAEELAPRPVTFASAFDAWQRSADR